MTVTINGDFTVICHFSFLKKCLGASLLPAILSEYVFSMHQCFQIQFGKHKNPLAEFSWINKLPLFGDVRYFLITPMLLLLIKSRILKYRCRVIYLVTFANWDNVEKNIRKPLGESLQLIMQFDRSKGMLVLNWLITA